MARESFDNPTIANFLNEHFINIKVDREELPDIDQIYMTAHQAMNEGTGGWPLNCFLTPERKPFFSGTYFPPSSKGGRAGFLTVLEGVFDAWKNKTAQITEFTNQLLQSLSKETDVSPTPTSLAKGFLPHTRRFLLSSGDEKYGGWGRAPKFPQYPLLRLMLQSPEGAEQKFALESCIKIAHSGLYDQIGGGFHRYCVDEEWIVPHFEKMLYDQAQLIDVYLDAYLVEPEALFRERAEETIAYVFENLTSPEGAFYSAQDAQSEGKEGTYFCWTLSELRTLLSAEELKFISDLYDLTEKGNFLDFSDPEPVPNLNVLHHSERLDRSYDRAALAKIKEKLASVRAKRETPHVDQKIQMSWNCLMINALVRASFICENELYLEHAKRAYAFLTSNLIEEGTLFHAYKDGKRYAPNLAVDIALFIRASRQLHEATGEAAYLENAQKFLHLIIEHYHDRVNGGIYETLSQDNYILRLKGEFDSALPTTSSVVYLESLYFAQIESDHAEKYDEVCQGIINYYGHKMESSPRMFGELLLSLATAEYGQLHLEGQEPELAQTLWKKLHKPLFDYKNPEENFSAIFCKNQTCSAKITDPSMVLPLLDEKRTPSRNKELR